MADSTEKPKTLEDSKIDIKDLIEIDDDKEIPESQRKRDSGYFYSRPSSSIYDSYRPSSARIKFPSRQSSNRVRPFSRYGPPNYSSHSRRPQNNKNPGQTQMEVPSLIKNTDFIEESPIASQNDSPFNPNSANYLPPKNQKLPTNLLAGTFQHHRPSPSADNNQVNNFVPTQYPQRYNLLQNPPQDSSTSDEDFFLQQNAQKIAQLYEAPASNINYPPYDDFQDSNSESQNPNSQFQIIAVDRPTNQQSEQQQQQQQQNSQGFSGPIPSYSSGILEDPRILDQIQSRVKDRIILQLQQALAASTHQNQDPASEFLRYAQNYGQTIKNENSLSSLGTTSQLDQGHQSIPSFGGKGTFSPSSLGPHNNFPVTYGLPLDSQTPTTTTNPPASSSTTISSSSHQPHGNGNNNGINYLPSSVPFSFPQYNGFIPTSIPSTNIITTLPNYGTNFLAPTLSNTPGQLPTHFGLPIPIIPDTKPEINPTLGKPTTNIPQIPFHQNIHPISNNQIFPVISSPIQPTLVNSVFIKPVKPVYPLYYYHHQNIAYPLQKHSLPVSPWNYAPAYSARKSSNI